MLRLLVAWFVGWALMACGSSTRPQTQIGQIIAISSQTLTANGSDTVRFGHMHEGETAVLPLLLRNDLTHPVVITSVERTCGCTILEIDNQPIMPGETRPASLTFDARGTWGWQLKLLKIHLAGSNTPLRIIVEAEVE